MCDPATMKLVHNGEIAVRLRGPRFWIRVRRTLMIARRDGKWEMSMGKES